MTTPRPLLSLAVMALLAACSRAAPPEAAPRPVKTLVVSAAPAAQAFELPGEVRARVESPLAFRVAGRVVRRLVDAGATVKKGQALAELDPADLRLAAAAAGAEVAAARSQFDTAHADLARNRDLRGKNFISQAELDRHENVYRAAASRLDAARAQAAIAANQSDYATLRAPADGVITAADAEPGQVVAAGQGVLQFAEPADKEIAVSVAENQVEALRTAEQLAVTLWAAPQHRYAGRLRELAPAADPVTRTYAARIAVPEANTAMGLGMTATVRVELPARAALWRLPLAALVPPAAPGANGQTGAAVWLVDEASGKVSRAPVEVAGFAGNEVLIAAGLSPGQRVVTAGAARLAEGHVVRLLPEDGAATTMAAPAVATPAVATNSPGAPQ